jgi:hypothetical protein
VVIRLKDDAWPDLKAWRQSFHKMLGGLFTIDGVEATIEGRLVEVKGELALRVGGDVVLRLGHLRRKVQQDPVRGRPQLATRAEKEALLRLAARWAKYRGTPPKVRIVGPLHQSGPGQVPVLTVREFIWD